MTTLHAEAIDLREPPGTWPGELRRSTSLAADVRANPILKTLIEGLVIQQTGGTTNGFTDRVALEYVAEALGPGAVDRYKAAASEVDAKLLALAAGDGWRATPLTVALTLGHDRRTPFDPAPHLRLVSDAIVRAVAGTGPRFIVVSMPPRYGKSTLVSRRTAGWFLACFPHMQVGVCGYGDEFAAGWGRMVRNDIQDSPERFGFGIAADSAAAAMWHTTLGGSMWCAGVGGAITGKGADLLIVDDPVKNAEEAASLVHRDKVWEWWTTTARTRLHRGAICVVVMTRWHSDDLAGRLMSGHDGTDASEWLEIKLPAVWEQDEPDALGRKKGDLLWPERFDADEVDKTRRSVGAETWSSLYQQVPVDQTALGRVYHAFSERNIVDTEYTDEFPICVTLDFNVDPASAIIAQVHEYFGPRAHLTNEVIREVHVLDEVSLPDSNTEALVGEVLERLRPLAKGNKVKVRIFGDASGAARRSSATKSDWQIVKAGFGQYAHRYSVSFYVPKDNPAIKDRTNAVNTALKNELGERRLFVHPGCKQLLADFRQVRWKRDSNGNPSSQLDKSDPKRSHCSDALGYLVYEHRDGLPTFGLKVGWAR